MKKRIVSILLAIVMLVGIVPVAAFAAAEGSEQAGITVYLTLFNKGEFCKTKDNELMWQKAVTVTDVNKDGNYSLDEVLKAGHTAYHANGAQAYATEHNEVYDSTSVIKLWGTDTYSTGYYRNNQMTNAVDKEFVNANDKITACIYYDESNWSDRYSYFTEEAKTVEVNQEFSLTVQYAGFDSNYNPVTLPVKTAPIGVYDMKTGAYSVPTTLKGEKLITGDFMPKVSTGIDGSATMRFTEIGRYYVTAQYNSSNYATYTDQMEVVPNYLVPSICVVTVVDAEIKAAEAKIDAIGTVNENSGDAIKAACNAYDALTDVQKSLVSNAKKLTDSEAAYEKIMTDKANKEKADSVSALIAAIGTVDASSGEKIAAARSAYDALTDAQKTMVSDYKVLTDAELAYAKIVSDMEDKKQAENVSALIAAIGTVDASSGEKIAAARTAYDALSETQKALVTNYDVLKKAEKTYFDANVQNIHAATQKYILSQIPEPVYGAEWAIFALARNGAKVPEGYYEKYFQSVEKYVKENIKEGERLHASKCTDNARLVIVLTAIGKDPRNVAGHNLLTALSDFDYVKTLSISGTVWTMLALDAHNYEIPGAADGVSQTTREGLVDAILSYKLAKGGWAFSGNSADPDMTGMAIQALAPYYKTNEAVRNAVDEALNILSAMQKENGGYASWGVETAESAAQVVTALSAMGIDANEDPRFVKENNSAYDALLAYYAVGGGFKSGYDNKVNMYTTCQAYYAMAAYDRYKSGKTALYDMSDVELEQGQDVDPESPQTGDLSSVAPILILLAVSGVAITACTLTKKKILN